MILAGTIFLTLTLAMVFRGRCHVYEALRLWECSEFCEHAETDEWKMICAKFPVWLSNMLVSVCNELYGADLAGGQPYRKFLRFCLEWLQFRDLDPRH